MSTKNEQLAFLCTSCKHLFGTSIGQRALNQHSRVFKSKRFFYYKRIFSPIPELSISLRINKDEGIQYTWGRSCDKEFEEIVSFVYEKVAYWKRNVFYFQQAKLVNYT